MKKIFPILSVLLMSFLFVEAQWSLTGNAGTNPPTNFLGTTDAKNLIFKTNGLQAGYLDYNSTTANTAFGCQALSKGLLGFNTAIGYHALYTNTPSFNDAFGAYALAANFAGLSNSTFGNNSLYFNDGNSNFAFGSAALNGNRKATNNVAVGCFSLANNSSDFASCNTAYGHSALTKINGFNDGANNIAFGCESGYASGRATANVALGYRSLYSNQEGNGNVGVGSQALFSLVGPLSSTDNCALGSNTLYSTISGVNNTAAGYMSLYSNSTGNYNTALGKGALSNNTTGGENTALGTSALAGNTTGSDNTAIGAGADVSAGNYGNVTVIGYLATATASSQIRVGNSSVALIGGTANWSNLSDGRFKKNIKENVPGLAFIRQLRPVTYNLDISGINKFLRPASLMGANGQRIAQLEENAEVIAQKERIVYTGFVAQEVESVAKKMNYEFSGIDYPKNGKDLYSIRYADFVVPLVKAVQELNTMQNSLKTRIDDMDVKLENLQKQIQTGKHLRK